jgi:hypothetical protein
MTQGHAEQMSLDHSPGGITELLRKVATGDQTAVSKLIPLVYAELRRWASYICGEQRLDHALQPRMLVNDDYLGLVERRDVSCKVAPTSSAWPLMTDAVKCWSIRPGLTGGQSVVEGSERVFRFTR